MKSLFKHIIQGSGLLISVIFLLTQSCAKVSSPTGGPRDTIPPFPVYSDPSNYSTNIKPEKIEIEFNEFIQLEDINNTLIVSPPLKEKPLVRLRGKAIDVQLKDTLRDSVTYTLNFGDAIVDNNESNPIRSFEFVFSTGNAIDSFAISGLLVNSFDLQPSEEPFYVMLYRNHHDTIPITTIPDFIGKTNEKGEFSINNLASGEYKLFALQDVNSNLLFDLPNEKIAFSDSVITLNPAAFEDVHFHPPDDTTVVSDTLHAHASDTIRPENEFYVGLKDTAAYIKTYGFATNLYYFEEEVYNQYLVDQSREDKHRLRIVLNEPFEDSITFIPIKPVIDSTLLLPEFSKKFDTLDFWLKDTTLANLDSLTFQLGFYADDTTGMQVWTIDTLDFVFRDKQSTERRKGREEIQAPQKAINNLLTTNYSNNKTIDLNTHLTIKSLYPIATINIDSLEVSELQDTVYIPVDFTLQEDTNQYRTYSVRHPYKSGIQYRYTIFPGTFQDIYNYGHDTTALIVSTQKETYYGKLILNLQDIYTPMIIQLMDKEKKKIIKEKYTNASDTVLVFDYLKPEAYTFKYIFDANSNKEWDTGNYLKHVQPERVLFLDNPITVRSNWEKEIIWSPLSKTDQEVPGEDSSAPDKMGSRMNSERPNP